MKRRRALPQTLVFLLAAAPGAAQTPAPDFHVAVHPREIATVTQNLAAGDFPLDSGGVVTVPPQCVGARRCPLLVVIPTTQMDGFIRPIANKYGIILVLTEKSLDNSVPDAARQLTAVLTQVLGRFAVDPDNIGIMGRCHTGPFASGVGFRNPEVFNRVVVASGFLSLPPAGAGQPPRRVELLVSNGIHDDPLMHYGAAPQLRRLGYGVSSTIAFRDHRHQWEDYDFVGHWLHESWASPDPAARPVPEILAPLPVLTSLAIMRMTIFWTHFLQEPDSIKTTARRAHLRAVSVPLGRDHAVAWMTDMTALAARYPSVAAHLKQAGLTPQQHDAYRVALLSALSIKSALTDQADLPPWLEITRAAAAVPDVQKTREDSALANHYDQALARFRFWEERIPPDVAAAGTMVVQARNASWTEARPALLDSLAATGIWLTP